MSIYTHRRWVTSKCWKWSKQAFLTLILKKLQIKSCHCWGIRSPFRVFLDGKRIWRSTNAYICSICAKKCYIPRRKLWNWKWCVSHLKKRSTSFHVKTKKGFQKTNPDRSILPCSQRRRRWYCSPPKGGKSCFSSKFRRMAPRPPTADLVHVKSTAF